MKNSSGLLATFRSQQHFIEALKDLKFKGFKNLDIATPQEIEGLSEILKGHEREPLYGWCGFIGAMLGLFGGFFMQWFASEKTPLNIGGRPLNSWPSFIPITYILMILGAALFLTVAFIIDLRLPWPSHPIFRTSLDLSTDNYALLVSSEDPLFDSLKTSELLRQLQADRVEFIP